MRLCQLNVNNNLFVPLFCSRLFTSAVKCDVLINPGGGVYVFAHISDYRWKLMLKTHATIKLNPNKLTLVQKQKNRQQPNVTRITHTPVNNKNKENNSD